jgi:hypothetical protein
MRIADFKTIVALIAVMRPWPRANRTCLIAALFSIMAALWAQDSLAQAWSIEPLSPNFTLLMSGTVDNGKAVDLSADMRIRVQGPANEHVYVRASFSDAIPDVYKTVQNIKPIAKDNFILDEKQLTAGLAEDLPVTLKRQAVSGVFGGSLTLTIVGKESRETLVPILVVIQESPTIELLNKPDTALLSNCDGACRLTRWLIPGSLRDQFHFTVSNKSTFPIKIGMTGVWRAVRQGTTQEVHQAKSKDSIDAGDEIPALERRDFTIPVERSTLPADHYKVDAQVSAIATRQLPVPDMVKDQIRLTNQSLSTLPLSMDIRDSAALPVFLVFVGVILGRAFSLLRSPSIATRLSLYRQTEQLRQQIRTLHDPASRDSLNREIEDIWAGFGTGGISLQSFQDSMTDIATKIATLRKQEEALDSSATLRVESATKITNLIGKSKAGLLRPGLDLQALSDHDSAMKVFGEATGTQPDVGAEIRHERVKYLRQRFARRVGAFVGIDTLHSTALLYTYVRPLSYLLIILAVALTGAFSQYASDAHSAFGSSYVDYLSIALWGFGSQVVAAGFGDIQSLK